MTDARWLEVDDDVHSAAKHFHGAVAIYDEGLIEDDTLEAYKGRMTYMQAGYTALQTAVERILEILGESKPTHPGDYHAQLVRRVSRELSGDRPAIFEGEVAKAVDEARKFRRLARKNYDDFEVERATPSVAAARLLAERLATAISSFKSKIDVGVANENDCGQGSGPAGR